MKLLAALILKIQKIHLNQVFTHKELQITLSISLFLQNGWPVNTLLHLRNVTYPLMVPLLVDFCQFPTCGKGLLPLSLKEIKNLKVIRPIPISFNYSSQGRLSKVDTCHQLMVSICMINVPNSSILGLGFAIVPISQIITLIGSLTLARRRSLLFLLISTIAFGTPLYVV